MTAIPNNNYAETKTDRYLRVKTIAIMTIAILCGAAYYKYQQWREPYREDLALHEVIRRLADHRPVDMTPKQWESAVAWTNNLHCNSLTFLAPAESIRKLRLDIEKTRRKLQLH